MDGMLPRTESGSVSDSCSASNNLHRDEVWYFSREEIEKNSPSRRDGIDLKQETHLRKLYCSFLKDLGDRLEVRQITIATAIVFCHRFFTRQSHSKNDSLTIATVCMLLARKVEETSLALQDVIIVSYEIIHKKELTEAQRKAVYEQQKELLLSGEELVLSTLNFDVIVHHPYKALAYAIDRHKVKEANVQFIRVAESFLNDCLQTTLYLQYKPQHIAACVFFRAVTDLKIDLQASQEVLLKEFDTTLSQLEDIRVQMLELDGDFPREEIEKNSPSRRDGISLKEETSLRMEYCTFLIDYGMRLKVPQRTIATAIVFCHRFFTRQSHAKNEKWTIAIVCLLLAGKVEETPLDLKDVISVALELDADERKELYEQQKELFVSGEELVLATLNFDLIVHHPYKPLTDAIKKYKVKEAMAQFSEVAESFVNDSLLTLLWLECKPQHIAAGAFFLAAEHLAIDLQAYREVLYQEFDITSSQLQDIRFQMLEVFEKKHIPAVKGSIEKSSDGTVKAIGEKAQESFEKGVNKRELMDENDLNEGEVEDEDDKTMQKRSKSFSKVKDSDSNRSVEEQSKILDAKQAGVGGVSMADASLVDDKDLKGMDTEDGEIVD